MKKIMILGLLGMILVGVASLTLPALADRTDSCYQYMGSDQDSWESIREACRSGAWDSQNESAGESQNGSFNYGYCHSRQWIN